MALAYEVWQDNCLFATTTALKDAARCANTLATEYPTSNVEVRRDGLTRFHGVARYVHVPTCDLDEDCICATDEQIERSFDAYR